MSNSYLSKENIFDVSGKIYSKINDEFNVNIEGSYLENIQKVMNGLWRKNKDKTLKKGQTQEKLVKALNKKTLELIYPQIVNSIQSGYLNQSNNNMFIERPQYNNAQDSYDIPRPSASTDSNSLDDKFSEFQTARENLFPKKEDIDFNDNTNEELDNNTNDMFEKIVNERKTENLYSKNNYQDKNDSYSNSLPKQVNIMGDANQNVGSTDIFSDVEALNNDYHPSDVVNTEQIPNNNLTEDSFNKLFETQKTNLESENIDVEKKFEDERSRYLQDGAENPVVRDATNLVEDVMNSNGSSNIKFTVEKREEERKKMEDDKKDLIEGFENNDDSNIIETNEIKYKDDMIINNALENENNKINYPLIPTEKHTYVTRKYHLVVDSLQRNFAINPYPTQFKVHFEEPEQILEVPSHLNSNGVVVYNKIPVLYEYTGGKGAKLENIYENILEVKCTDVQIPFDRYYVGGKAPYDFNGPRIDENKVNPDQFGSYPYGPIYKDDYGIPIDILDEPYYFLVVNELDGAYDGTNLASQRALAKLNFDKLYGMGRRFLNLRTSTGEGKIFYPTTLAKLSHMTLNLVTRFSKLLNVGVDKVWIDKIEQGEENDGKYCDIPIGDHLTKITIIPDDPEYLFKLCSHGNDPGDRLLFYSLFTCSPLSSNTYTKLNEKIKINIDNYPCIYFYMIHEQEDAVVEKKIDVRQFLGLGDLIIVNDKYILNINEISDSGLLLDVCSRNNFRKKVKINKLGFIKKDPSGVNSPNVKNFLSQSGHRIGGDLTEPFTFQLLYSFECIPKYLQSAPFGFYKSKEAFYIHAKKQITYNFEVIQNEKDMEQLTSTIIPNYA